MFRSFRRKSQVGKDAALTVKVKTDVAARGTGKNKRVEVKKKDGTKLKGYVSQAGEDSFTLIDSKTNQPVENRIRRCHESRKPKLKGQ